LFSIKLIQNRKISDDKFQKAFQLLLVIDEATAWLETKRQIDSQKFDISDPGFRHRRHREVDVHRHEVGISIGRERRVLERGQTIRRRVRTVVNFTDILQAAFAPIIFEKKLKAKL